MVKSASAALSCLFVLGPAARRAEAQALHTLESPNAEVSGFFGQSVSGADVNGDGHADLIVGAYGETGGATGAGRAYILNGLTGGVVRTLLSPNVEVSGGFGNSVSRTGDVNGDGLPDVVVGAYEEDGGAEEAGRAYIFRGSTGGVLHTLQSAIPDTGGRFGGSVSGAGDVNNDGRADVIVGASKEDVGATSSAGRAYIFNGDTGAWIYTLPSPNAEAYGQFGGSVSGAGDVNNDGRGDVVVGASREDGGAVGAGRAYIFSGNGGGLLRTLQSPNAETQGRFGAAVSGAGDVNGDGHGDVIVGAWLEDGGADAAGRAYVFNGNTGGLLYAFQSPTPTLGGKFGVSVSGAGDMNGDGHADVIVGAGQENGGAGEAGRAYVFSGSTGGVLYTFQSPNPESGGLFGARVSGAGDVSNDGLADLVVGAISEDGGATSAGRAYVFGWMSLSGSLLGGWLTLEWSTWPVATAYWVYGADNEAYFAPGLTSPYQHRLVVLPPATTIWPSTSGVGDPAHNWTYLVIAVDASGQELCRSNRFGEHDFGTVLSD